MHRDTASRPGGEVGVAVVGYGYWGPNLARNVVATPGARLVAICDRDVDRRRSAEVAHQSAVVTEDWDALLADRDVDAVIISLPVALHHPYALAACQAGKHVLVEKPLARSVAECDELIAAAERSRSTLMVGHTFEFNAAVELIAQYIRSGELGDPYYVVMRRANLGIVRDDENVLWSLAPHDISILIHWLQRAPLRVHATGLARLRPGIEDVAFLSIAFEENIIGHVHCSWLDPNKIREATVVGSRKMAVYDDTSPDMKVRLYDKGIVRQTSLGRYETFSRFQMLARSGDILVPKVEFREPLANEIRHFVDCIIERRPPLTDGLNGRRVVAVLEAAQRSLENDGASEPVAGVRTSRAAV
jgi:predicted dehydrogenase